MTVVRKQCTPITTIAPFYTRKPTSCALYSRLCIPQPTPHEPAAFHKSTRGGW